MNRKSWRTKALILAVALGLWSGWRSLSTSPRDESVAADEARPSTGAAGRPRRDLADRPPPSGAPRGRLQLAGQVIGADGVGVGGAEVSLSGASAKTVRSAADGTFTFEDMDAAEYVIRAKAGDLTGGPVPVRAPGDPVLVRLHLGASLVVHVVEESGEPVVSAEVGLLDDPSTITRTDGAGLVTLEGVRAGYVGVIVSGAGYATSEVSADATPGMTVELTVTLRPAYTVSGSVVDGRGRPVAGAHVSVRGGLGGVGIRGAQAVTDPEGRFTMTALGAGTHTLVATDGKHAPTEGAPVTITDRPIAGVTITLKDGGAIDGLVTRSDSEPARAATVWLVGQGSSFTRELRTDAQGRFRARGLPRALLQLRAESDGAASDTMDVDLASEADRPEVTLVLDAVESIAGVVVDSQGHRVAGVQVTAYPDAAATSPYTISRALTATTDRGGAFSMSGVHPGNYRLFATGAPGLRNPVERGVPAAAGDRDVRIALVAGGVLRGSLRLSQSGAPPSLAELQLGQQSPVSIAGGTIEIGNIPLGTYDLSIRGAEFAELVRPGVVIRAGQTTDLGMIELPAGRTLVGEVVDGGFGSVVGTVTSSDPPEAPTTITMVARHHPGPPLVTRAGDDGGFRFTEVAEGEYSVSAIQTQPRSARTANATIEVAAGTETAVALRFPRGPITLSVKLEPPAGGTAAEATVFLFRGGVAASTESQLMQVVADGKLVGMMAWRADEEPPAFEDLTPDSYSVCALAARTSPTATGAPTSPAACRQVAVLAAPREQTVSCQLPGGG